MSTHKYSIQYRNAYITFIKNLVNWYMYVTLAIAYVSSKFNIYKENAYMWLLINLPDTFWMFLWRHWSGNWLEINIVLHGYPKDLVSYKSKFAFYHGLYMENNYVILKTTCLRDLLDGLEKKYGHTIYSTVEGETGEINVSNTITLTYTIQNTRTSLLLDIAEKKFRHLDNWQPILFSRIRL